MISLQRSMHSSQMYTPGPAISFLTCFCDLPQKEHFSRSPPSPNLAIVRPLVRLPRCPGPTAGAYAPGGTRRQHHLFPCVPASACLWVPLDSPSSAPPVAGRRRDELLGQLAALDDLIDDAVFLGLRRRHDEVAVGVPGNLVDR